MKASTKDRIVLHLTGDVPWICFVGGIGLFLLLCAIMIPIRILFGVHLGHLFGSYASCVVYGVPITGVTLGMLSYLVGCGLARIFYNTEISTGDYLVEEVGIGTVHLTSGLLLVGDPFQGRKSFQEIAIPPGEYRVSVRVSKFVRWSRVVGIIVEKGEAVDRTSVEVGEVATNSASLLLVDSGLTGPERSLMEVFRSADLPHKGMFVLVSDSTGQPRGAATKTGLGDGHYPVNVMRGIDDACRVECMFIDEVKDGGDGGKTERAT